MLFRSSIRRPKPIRRLLPWGALACLAASAGAQLAVPAGFVDELVYGTGFASPTALALVPDGRFFVLENNTANVKLVAGTAAATVFTVPNVSTNSDRGLQGIVLDPLWPTWPYAYLHYTHTSGTVRVVRYTVSGAVTSPASTAVTFGSPYEIINDAPDTHFWHNGGTLRFGPDGFLYVSLGDDNAQCDAQNLESLRGAILRLDVGPLRGAAGSGPPAKSLIAAPGNPFVGTNGQLVYAYGLRNPFRFDVDPVTNRLYVADVGAGAFEELDEIVAGGANFGWPYFEGNAPFATCPAPTPAWTAPIYTHPNPGGAAIALFGGRYRNPPLAPFGFGPSYEGDVFVVDVVQGFVRRLRETGGVWAPAPAAPGQPNATDWANGFAGIVDAAVGPDGAIYYLKTFSPGQLRRVRTTGNTLSVVSGAGQAGNAGMPLFSPLVVKVAAADGAPLAGVPVTFATTVGEGTPNPAISVTDAAGLASTSFVLGKVSPVDPVVVATAPGVAGSVGFSVDWRGLVADYDALTGTASLTLHHSATSTPFTVVFDYPRSTPLFGFPFGDVWTNVLGPGVPWGHIDGLGILGTPCPAYVTGAVDPTWTVTVVGLPPAAGFSLLTQGYSVDLARLPDLSAFMVTQPVTVDFY